MERANEAVEQAHALRAERPAAVEPSQIPLGRGEPCLHHPGLPPQCRLPLLRRPEIPCGAPGELHRQDGRRLQCGGGMQAGRLLPIRRRSHEGHHHGLAHGRRRLEEAPGNGRIRGLRDQHDDGCRWIAPEQGHPVEHRAPADRRGQISSPGAERMRNAAAQAVDDRDHLLEPGPRRRHDSDRSPPDPIGKPERGPSHERGPAVRAHAEKPPRPGGLFEPHFVLHGHIVAEQHHVQPGVHRLAGNAGSEPARNGNEREIRPGQQPRRAGYSPGAVRTILGPGRRAAAQQVVQGGERGADVLFGITANRHDQIIG